MTVSQQTAPATQARGRRTASKRRRPATLADFVAKYLERDGRSLNQIAQAAWMDVGYLWRLRAGQKQHPSRDVLIRLALALKLEPEELDELLVSADYAPVTLRQY